ncbi:biotin--[acetyl-CoA-carboxylase] ligase [Lacimonas salitolerans]|uniref:biotin--[biotin carboxyl-carrier protein] ligase n=1 Tax=Lacimonas salitolerans TaxID=1323750 RepID=A0ABW4EFA0_9RHOB
MTWPAGYGRRVLAEVDSTNAEAVRIAPTLTGPEWILGLRQTQGRGRRGRPWRDPGGNFAGTLVLRPEGPPGHVALLSFVAALALHDACCAVTGRPQAFELKWPNDVLLNGGKLAGILLESTGVGTGVAHLAIGIGVNLREVPEAATVEPGALRPVALMTETGIAVTPEECLDLLAAAFATRKAQFDADGFAPIREAWLARAARLGEDVIARTLRSTMEGRFETIDDTGNLVLVTAQGRMAIPAADIFFEGGTDASGD